MEMLLRVLVDEVCGEVGADAARELLLLHRDNPEEAPRKSEAQAAVAPVYTLAPPGVRVPWADLMESDED